MPPPRIHAIIADDHAIVRAGLRAALETPGNVTADGIAVVAEACDGLEAIALTRKHRPQLLILDVQMPLAGGHEVLAEVRRWSPDTRVAVLTGVLSAARLAQLVAAGADGLFAKGAAEDRLLARLPLILSGGRHVDPELAAILAQAADRPALSARETQILNLVAQGRSNRDMAGILGISAKTVDRHRTAMMAKLGVHSVAELVALALREGLLGEG